MTYLLTGFRSEPMATSAIRLTVFGWKWPSRLPTFSLTALRWPSITRRTEESILLTATLMEDSLDLTFFNMMQMAFNNNEVTEVARTTTVGGYSQIDLYQGPHVQKFQFVARAMSDPDQGGPFPLQFWIPVVRLAGSISSAFVKGDPLMVEASFMALYHPLLAAGNLRKFTSVHS